MALTGFGLTHRYLNENEIETILADSLAGMPLDGKRLLTRLCSDCGNLQVFNEKITRSSKLPG